MSILGIYLTGRQIYKKKENPESNHCPVCTLRFRSFSQAWEVTSDHTFAIAFKFNIVLLLRRHVSISRVFTDTADRMTARYKGLVYTTISGHLRNTNAKIA